MKLFKRSAIMTFAVVQLVAVLAIPTAAHTQGKAYTLGECVDRALKVDLNVVRAENGVMQAKADVLAAWGSFLPSLDFRLNRTHTRTHISREYDRFTFTIRDTSYTEKIHRMNMVLETSLTLFDGFGQYTYLAGTKAGLDASRHSLSYQRLVTVYNVKNSYFSLLRSQALRDIGHTALERSQELMKIAETKYELGSASLSDVLKAKVQLSQAQLDLLKAENAVKVAQANLAYAIGERIDAEIVVEDIEPPDADYTVSEVTQQALQRNPEYLTAEAELRHRRHNLNYARRGYLPTLTVGATRQWNDYKTDVLPDYSWIEDDDVVFWGRLSFNIFNRFATRAQTSYAKANLHSAEYQLSDMRRDVARQARESDLNLQEKLKARELADEKLASAQEDHKLAQEKYRLGAATILDILDAEISLKQAESDKINSRYEYYLAVARLQKVMGVIE